MVGYYNSKIQFMTFSTVPVSVFSPVLGGEREAQDSWGGRQALKGFRLVCRLLGWGDLKQAFIKIERECYRKYRIETRYFRVV
jgi:hypothetical protein